MNLVRIRRRGCWLRWTQDAHNAEQDVMVGAQVAYGTEAQLGAQVRLQQWRRCVEVLDAPNEMSIGGDRTTAGTTEFNDKRLKMNIQGCNMFMHIKWHIHLGNSVVQDDSIVRMARIRSMSIVLSNNHIKPKSCDNPQFSGLPSLET